MAGSDNASKEAPDTPRGKDALKAVAERIKRGERDVPGAPIRKLKESMLDATPLEEQDKDNHYRYVGARDPNNVRLRQRQGYTAVPEAEAESAGVEARHGGEDILMRMPREEYERQVKEVDKETKDRLAAPKAEFQRVVEGVVRELRDKHGVTDTNLERMLKE